MKKNGFFAFGALVVLLVMGFVLAGCPNDTTEEQDTWSDVTSLDQIDGTWKGFYSRTMTMKEIVEDMMEATWNNQMQEIFGNMKVAITAAITMTIIQR